MHTSISAEPAATVVVAEGEVTKKSPYEQQIDVPEGATHAIVLLESLSGGRADLEVDVSSLSSEEREELSRLNSVRLRFIRLADSAEVLAVSVTSRVKSLVRVTVAFLKKEVHLLKKKFSCRACKQLCKLTVSVLLAHFGVPYLTAEATIVVPGIKSIEELSTMKETPASVSDLLKSIQSDEPVELAVGKPVLVPEACRSVLTQPDTAPGWVREMFDLIDPIAVAAVRGAFEVLDWVFDATDRLYTAACERIGMCTPEPAMPHSVA